MKSFTTLRIVFFGTPDFAVASLRALVETSTNIVAVVTAPDKPAGRGMQLQQSAVKQYAASQNLKILQPEKLKEADFIETLKELNANLFIVVAFRMLPEAVWNMPPLGTINVHASLLPQYRGAAPINWVIINGEKETGVTTFKLKHEIDTGNILLQKKIPIASDDNVGLVYEKLMHEGAALLIETVKRLANNSLQEQPQSSILGELKHAPKLFKDNMRIDWHKTTEEIYNHVRGLSPYPAAWTMLGEKTLKIYSAHFMKEANSEEPGKYFTDSKSYLRFATNDGWLYVDELQIEGKKKMSTVEFLKGFRG